MLTKGDIRLRGGERFSVDSISRADGERRHFVDSFVYFSHHRISCPPLATTATAHRLGTKVFGTVIFEWEEGAADLRRLLDGSMPHVIDKLVQLAVERGFDGWLINIEVGLKDPPASECLQLLSWLRELTRAIESSIEGGEVIWYDAVTTKGELRWQNQLNKLNAPFFDAASTIFLNYGWSPLYPGTTTTMVEGMRGKSRETVYFGVDVWGRGQYGGGGFETWRSLDKIQQVIASDSDDRTNLSTALFAPAWSIESSTLAHDIGTEEGYEKWVADDRYLWIGGAATTNAIAERARLEDSRREYRGKRRAIDIATGCTAIKVGDANPKGEAIDPFNFDSNGIFPEFPPAGDKPISHYFDKRIPPTSSFYTNFSSGSGYRFFVEGVAVDSVSGWTDVDFHFPAADRIDDEDERWRESRKTEEDAWFGNCSISVVGRGTVPLCSTRIAVTEGMTMEVTVVWKSLESDSASTIRPDVELEGDVDDPSTSVPTSRVALGAGWVATTLAISFPSSSLPFVISSVGVAFVNSTDSTAPTRFLIGSLSVELVESKRRSIGINSKFDKGMLEWDVEGGGDGTSDQEVSNDEESTPCLMYLVYVFPLGDESESPSPIFLGSTSGTEFELGGVGAGQVLCVRGVHRDGSIVAMEESSFCIVE